MVPTRPGTTGPRPNRSVYPTSVIAARPIGAGGGPPARGPGRGGGPPGEGSGGGGVVVGCGVGYYGDGEEGDWLCLVHHGRSAYFPYL